MTPWNELALTIILCCITLAWCEREMRRPR